MTLVQWDPFRGSRAWEPAVDIVEREDAIVLRAELPGVDRDATTLEATLRRMQDYGTRF